MLCLEYFRWRGACDVPLALQFSETVGKIVYLDSRRVSLLMVIVGAGRSFAFAVFHFDYWLTCRG